MTFLCIIMSVTQQLKSKKDERVANFLKVGNPFMKQSPPHTQD